MKLPFGIELTRRKAGDPVPLPMLGVAIHSADRTDGQQGRLASGKEEANLRNVGGKRVSVETDQEFGQFAYWNSFASRKAIHRLGLGSTFDIADFQNLDFDYLAELLADLSPEISKALWDFLIMSNPGYTIKALSPKTREIDARAQIALDAITDTLDTYNGTLGTWFDRQFKMIFLRGGFLQELVLADNGRDFADIATPDVKTLTFRRRQDEVRGSVWDFGQRQRGEFVSLDIPTIRYVPVHPSPDSIEGHSLCSSSFFLAIFLMSILRDTKRVIQHQGYLRLDVQIEFEKLKDTMPTELQGDPAAVTKWMQDITTAVVETYRSLEPDDTYIHSDSITINNPVGTVSADSLQALDAMFQALERMSVRALKTMPLLMGTNQSRSETQANREWEIYAKGIETVQHWLESATEYTLKLALQAQGIQAEVRVRFAQFRSAEAMRDAQVDMLKSKTARENYENGYISQDAAALYAVNAEEADSPVPRSARVAAGTADASASGIDGNPSPGESRGTRAPDATRLEGARSFIAKFSPDLIDLYDAEVATPEDEAEPEAEVDA